MRLINRVLTPDRSNVSRPTIAKQIVGDASPHVIDPIQPGLIPRYLEDANDLLGQPGDEALRWRDLGNYLFASGIGRSDACMNLALHPTQIVLDYTQNLLERTTYRGTFRFENNERSRYFFPDAPDGYAYPPGLDLYLADWSTVQFPNTLTFHNDILYSSNEEERHDQLLDQDRNLYSRPAYPFRATAPSLMPVRTMNDGVERDVVRYTSDAATAASIEIGPSASKYVFRYPADSVVVSCLLRQTAGPALGTNSGIWLEARLFKRRRESGVYPSDRERRQQVPFDVDGRGFASFSPPDGAFDDYTLINQVLTFDANIAMGVSVDIVYVLCTTPSMPSVG